VAAERILALETAQVTLRRQLQDEPSHGPTMARYPAARATAAMPPPGGGGETAGQALGFPRPAPGREYTSFDGLEEANLTLAAGTAFQEIITFSGRPDSITVTTIGSTVDIRIRDRGRGPGRISRFIASSVAPLLIPGEIVEARDSAGVGGMLVVVRGLYASGDVAVRNHLPAPPRAEGAEPTPAA